MPPTRSGAIDSVWTARTSAASPARTASAPMPRRMRPAVVRAFGCSAGRRAVRGLTRTTPRVGSHAATTVVSTPPTKAAVSHTGENDTAPKTSSPARARSRAVRATPPPRPTMIPVVAATTARTIASTRTDRRT